MMPSASFASCKASGQGGVGFAYKQESVPSSTPRPYLFTFTGARAVLIPSHKVREPMSAFW
jgi:hypothetical protein